MQNSTHYSALKAGTQVQVIYKDADTQQVLDVYACVVLQAGLTRVLLRHAQDTQALGELLDVPAVDIVQDSAGAYSVCMYA